MENNIKVLKAGSFASLRENSAEMIRLAQAAEDAKRAYKAAKAQTTEVIVGVLREHLGAYMTCGDLSAATGMNTASIAKLLSDRPDVIVQSIPVTKRMVELDEDGQVMPWTERIEVYKRTGYTYCDNKRRW